VSTSDDMELEASHGRAADAGGRSIAIKMLLAVLLPVALLLPFLNKAVHIDDPLFIWSAKQILESPFDFYGFEQNWYISPQPMYEINQNPPLVAYWLAPAGALLGWEEWKLHLAMMPWAMLAAWGMFLLARRFDLPPLAATVLLVVSPGFLVSASSLMTDVPMIALWLLATVAWLRGLDKGAHHWLAISGVLTGLAILTKYFAISLLPLLAVYTLVAAKDFRRSVIWLLLPVAMLACYELWTRQLYGMGLFLDAILYASGYEASYPVSTIEKIATGVVFTGAAIIPATLWLAWLSDWGIDTRKVLLWAALAVLGVVLVLTLGLYSNHPNPLPFWVMLQWAFGFATGGAALFMLIRLSLQWRDAEALLLLLWVVGTLVFACFLNHYVNVRVILPLAPALVLAGLRMTRGRFRPEAFTVVAGIGLVLAMIVGHGDYKLANAQRDAVEEIGWLDLTEPLSFTGHWGFQYYMEELGGEILDLATMEVIPGQTLIIPSNNTNVASVRDVLVADTGNMSVPVRAWASTMHTATGAGFYSDVWGPLPFVLGPVPDELYGIAILRTSGPALVQGE